MLDTKSPIPLYYQLKTNMEEKISSGQWKPGDRVPSESELGEQFQVSRTTVRQALAELTNRGLLTRVQGRGTFVAQPRIQQRLVQLTGFTQDMHSRGKSAGAKTLQFEVIPAPAPVAQALQIEKNEPVILLKRLRLADQEPVAVEASHLVYTLCKDLLNTNLTDRSLYRELSEKWGLVPTSALQQLEATSCPVIEARLLGITKGSPVLHIYRTTFDQLGRPFEQVESYYRGDRYVFQAELTIEKLNR